MHYFFTSESVSEGHPDAVADKISNRLCDELIARDPESHCGIEVAVTTGQVYVFGEVKSKAYIDIQNIVRETVKSIGYTDPKYQFDGDSCGVITAIHEQSPDIDMGVTREKPEDTGAGDQGLIFSYSCTDTPNYMPLTIDVANKIIKVLENIRKNELELMPYLRPDAKSQVTVEYDENNKPVRIDTILVSTAHDEFADDETMLARIRKDIKEIVIPRTIEQYPENIQKMFGDDIKLLVNPTGRFVLSGPSADGGATNRKLGVNLTGGWGGFGGGGVNGKCAYKVDRSAAYMTRYISKNAVAAGLSERLSLQVAYAIGVAEPVSFFVDTFGTAHVDMSDGEIAQKLQTLFDLRPYAIIRDLKLKNPIYEETSSGGHIGRTPEVVHKHFESRYEDPVDIDVELFTWEKLDAVDKIKAAFGL